MVEIKTKNPQLIITLSYIIFAICVTLVFYLAAVKKGTYSGADILLGAVWTFILSIVISASIIPGFIKKRIQL